MTTCRMTCSRTSKPGLVHHVTGEGDSCTIKRSGGRWASQPTRRGLSTKAPRLDTPKCIALRRYKPSFAPSPKQPKPPTQTDPRRCGSHHINASADGPKQAWSRGRHLAGNPRPYTCGKTTRRSTLILGRSDSTTRRLCSRHVWSHPKATPEPFAATTVSQTPK